CEESYFDFSHLYTCGGPTQLPSCSAAPAAPASVPFSVQELVRTSRQPKCFFGAGWDSGVVERDEDRPSCTTDLSCAATLRTRTGLPAGITDEGIVDLGVMCVGAAPVTTVNTRCSRDPSRLCTPATVTNDCGAGDSCVAGLAPPGGCWDDSVKSCRFTPRVMVQDNWGWCTGECRNQVSAGTLTDNFTANLTTPAAKHVYGGCYSGNVLGTNVQTKSNVSSDYGFNNECSTGSMPDKNLRPWIVYPGSVNLRGNTNTNASELSQRFVIDPLRVIRIPGL
ncbi:hypothetical protein KBA73_00645, partial [Patescibacteria group bacterium]|nr:hypothetical protein [Patescibacteria group bacterium]